MDLLAGPIELDYPRPIGSTLNT